MSFIPSSPELFFSRNDPKDPRLGESVIPVKAISEASEGILIAGYSDDEGIRLNGGRPGAHLGPSSIRKYLYKMTPHLKVPNEHRLFDLGDLTSTLELGARHQLVRAQVASALEHGLCWIGLGGGHDYGYADGAGFLDWCKKSTAVSKKTKALRRPLVINLDAHLDVRSTEKGLTSGTPFFRLLEEYEEFDFCEIGIQSQCNSRNHLAWALDKKAHILSLDEIMSSGIPAIEKMLSFLEPWLVGRPPVFLSLDIDALSNAYAPGCSQSFALGLNPQDVTLLIQVLKARCDLRVFSIYEVSPPLDVSDITSRLAALLLHKFVG